MDIDKKLVEAVQTCIYNPQQAMEILIEVLDLGRDLNDKQRILVSIVEGRYQYLKGNFARAERELMEALEMSHVSQEVPDMLQGLVCRHLGYLYIYHAEVAKANVYFQMSLKYDRSNLN